jgi:carboxypeptidase PM20D1
MSTAEFHLPSSDAVGRLGQLIQCQTISSRIAEASVSGAFERLFAILPEFYPAIWSHARVDAQPPWRLIVEVPGTRRELEPVLFLAHFDVVDVEQGTTGEWVHPPFAGVSDAEFIWGRGAIDDKSVFCALLESLEQMLASEVPFARGVVLAFGGDEELSGHHGARTIAREFEEAGRRFHFILDEGGVIASGMLSTPTEPIALIGVSEKGFCNILIEADATGGHASMPPRQTAVGHVARAITRIERSPFRGRLLPSIRTFFAALVPASRGPQRLFYRHLRLLWPLFSRVLSRRGSTDALIRTTQAATVLHGSNAANVLPQSAAVIINNRILPGDTTEMVLAHYTRLLRDLPVSVSLDPESEHTEPVSETRTDHPGYLAVVRLCRELFPQAIPAPFLVTGSTDSKWYRNLSDAIIRFVPVTMTNEDLARVHGTNERIEIRAFKGLIVFYRRLLEEACSNG